MHINKWLMIACVVGYLGNTHAETISARDIMDKVDSITRQVADGSLSKSTLSTCPFVVENKRVSCSDAPRVKVMESVQVQKGPHKKDSQSVAILLEPASERGIGMLTYSYDDPQKDTESWLYLSALGKVKRMATGSSEEQEPVAVFGSEFTTEDMENGKIDEYDYQILQQGPYQGREVWVIEALPKPERLRKTRYSKWLFWIDKERWLPLKVQTYDKRGKLYKRMMAAQIEKEGAFWVAKQMTVYNMKTQRMSNMQTNELVLGIEVEPEFLTQRTLTDFAFREKVLEQLRENWAR